ncbi:STAS domain-containing protein [Megalodesulfovibrio paquesii]
MEDSILMMFVEDAREHLVDIEQDLLDIEEAGDGVDPELVNKVFRTAHSIKGSAAFLGLTAMRDLSHGIENVLDQIRGRELAPSHQVINVVLAAFDSLRFMLEDIEHCDQVDVAPHLQALTALVQGSLPQEQRETVTTMLALNLPDGRPGFSISEHSLAQARKGGNFTYLVEYDLIHHVHRQGKTPLDLLRFLEKSGRILDCRVDFAAVGTLDDDPANCIPLYLLYASILEPDLVGAIFQLPLERIHLIDETVNTPRKAASREAACPSSLTGPSPVDPKEVEAMTEAFDRSMQAAREALLEPAPPVAPMPEGVTFELLPEGGRLRLSGRGTVDRAQELKQALLAAMDQHPTLELDCGGLEEVDVTFLQLLWATWLSAKARGRAVACTTLSPALTHALELAGFHRVAFDRYGIVDFPGSGRA